MCARRRLVAGAVAAVLALAGTAGCGGSSGQGDRSGSTLRATAGDADGDGSLDRGPGEPLRGRTELAPATAPGRTLAVFAQIADPHVRDEESPARVPFLDRLGSPFHSTFRPQEALSAQALAAAVRSIEALRPQAVVETGDLVDNAQQNELDLALAVLRGGRVDPDSGGVGYRGVQSAGNPDPFYYRPGVDAPHHPGLLAEAQRPFASRGLRAPWYPVAGNHDLLAQGEIAPTPRTRAAAVGARAVVGLAPRLPLSMERSARGGEAVDRLIAGAQAGRSVRVPADPARRQLDAAAVLARLRAASGGGGRGPFLDYSFDIGPRLRAIVLDTARRDAGAEGLVRQVQLRWLREALAAAGRRWVVVFSHHPLAHASGGPAALALLDRHPRMAAAIAGHTHRNRIAPRRSSAGGYWLVTTASLADYPQQSRAFRLREASGGGVALETWMLDPAPGDALAAVARRLAFLDAQGGRPAGFAGRRLDRNVRLYRSGPRRARGSR